MQSIPLNNSPNHTFSVTLSINGVKHGFELFLSYNEVGEYWNLRIRDYSTKTILLDSIPLLTDSYPNAGLLSQYAYLGIGNAYITKAAPADADFPDDTNLGTIFKLTWGDNVDYVSAFSYEEAVEIQDSLTSEGRSSTVIQLEGSPGAPGSRGPMGPMGPPAALVASDAEVIAGTDDAKIVTPAGLTAKLDTDGTLAGNLDTRIPTQKAVKTYVDTKVSHAPGVKYLSSYADLATAISIIGDTEAVLVIDEAATISADSEDITTPPTLVLEFINGNILTIATTKKLTINGPFEAGLYQVFSCTGTGQVLFGTGTVRDVIATWFGSAGAAIQQAITASELYVKKVYIPSGTWLIDTEIQLPTAAAKDGVEIYGAKSEASYSYDYPLAYSTILKANSVMDSVFRARVALTTVFSEYTKISNMLIHGDSKADYGYINGAQDFLSDMTIVGCARTGIYCGTYTNSTILNRVNCVGNTEDGIVLAGDYSTVVVANNCCFRSNGRYGIYMISSIASSFNECVMESNGSEGLYIDRGSATAEQQVLNVRFNKCYFESNSLTTGAGGYQILLDGAGEAQNIVFDQPHINSGADGILGVKITKASNIAFKMPTLYGVNMAVAGWFNVASAAEGITIENLPEEYLTAVTWDGAGYTGGKVTIYGYKTTGSSGQYITNSVQTNIIKKQIDAPSAVTLTKDQVAGTIVTNYRQAAEDVIVDIPNGKEGYEITAVVLTAQGGNYWELRDQSASALIYLEGALVGYVRNTPAVAGAAIRLTGVTSSVWGWIAEPIYGTWVGEPL